MGLREVRGVPQTVQGIALEGRDGERTTGLSGLHRCLVSDGVVMRVSVPIGERRGQFSAECCCRSTGKQAWAGRT